MRIIKERYKELTTRELSLQDFQEIVDLKNLCKLEINLEYDLLCDILIIDIYINENLLDEALNTAMKSLNNIDEIVFKKLYISLLERIIYIYIQKKNFKSAYRYAFLKRNSIDLENVDEVNRWYLELAYIYAELNQKDKALLNLKAILSNYPDESLKALALSNMSKLYIDEGLVDEAKKSLSDCIKLVDKLNDEEGRIYLEYLNAKLYAVEKNYKLARQGFHDLFKNLKTLPNDYLSIANEYISLLTQMQLYDEALKVSNKYLSSAEACDDLYIKKEFYKNYLKISILKNKHLKEDLSKLLNKIDELEKEIVENDANIINETNEDDKNLEINARLKNVIDKIEKTINLINIALINNNERDCLIEFSKHLESIVSFNEALYVVFTKATFEMLPEFFENINKVNTYNYKKQRLYEREFSYNNINGTIIEMLISANHEMMVDFNDSLLPLKDLITNKTYLENKVKSLIAIPLKYEKEMFACAVFTSIDNSLNESDAMITLKIACKLLEFKLISLYYQESLRAQRNILQIAINDLQDGMFYYEPIKQKMIFTEQLARFLNIEHLSISKDDYLKLINDDDLHIYQTIKNSLDIGESYKIEYNLKVKDKMIRVLEKASPYISQEGIIKFYVGTINKVDNAVNLEPDKLNPVLSHQDFLNFYQDLAQKAKDIEFKFTLVHFQITNIDDFALDIKDKAIEYIYQVIKDNLSIHTYCLKDYSVLALDDNIDQRIIEKKVKVILGRLDQGIKYKNEALNFDSKVSVVRYPRDSHHFEEILEFSNMALLTSNRYQLFTEEIHKNYLKKNTVTTCVNEQIKKGHVEILYLELLSKVKKAYEVKYNITGLKPKEAIYEFIDEKIVIPFEKIVLSSLINEIKGLSGEFYLHLSALTLDSLMKDDFFSEENREVFVKVIICVDDYCDNLDKLLIYLDRFGFKVNINNRILKKINLGLFLEYKINGITIDEAINADSRQKLLKICHLFNYELLTNYEFPDYNHLVIRSEKLLNYSQLSNDKKI